jgi:shikimate dehydrogenase
LILIGLIGHPVGQSLSPLIHETWLAEKGLEGRYQALDVSAEELGGTIRRLAEAGWRGVNVTIPHKEAALLVCDELTEAAEAIGAVNCLTFEGGRILGDNTDWRGFEAAQRSLIPLAPDDHAVVLGAGGAAAGIIHALKRAGCAITVLNRTRAKAERFGGVAVSDWAERATIASRADLLVNTTSLGMAGQPTLDLPFEEGAPQAVIDIVYKPLKTDLLVRAGKKGALVQNGLPMLLHQAAPAFSRWTGASPADPAALLTRLEGAAT